MAYICGVCGKQVEKDLILFQEHTEQHIVDLIQKKHPEWASEDGLCSKCLDYYRAQIKGDS